MRGRCCPSHGLIGVGAMVLMATERSAAILAKALRVAEMVAWLMARWCSLSMSRAVRLEWKGHWSREPR